MFDAIEKHFANGEAKTFFERLSEFILYLIRALRSSLREQKKADMGPGDIIGEPDLLMAKPANISANYNFITCDYSGEATSTCVF